MSLAAAMLIALCAFSACGSDDPETFPTSAPPPGFDNTSKRDRYFPVQYVLDSNVILATSVRRLEFDSTAEARILVEGTAVAQTGPFKREYEVLLVDGGDNEWLSPDTLTFDVDIDREQPFARAVTLPLDSHLVGVRFRPLDPTVETKTYVIDLTIPDIPYTSSIEIYR
jgi:hypothetical protein